MGYTLDQLLDETGVTKLAGVRSSTKTAAEKFSFAKLAERCRKAAEATPEEMNTAVNQDLAEKTAQVEIIRHTMAEIDSILSAGPAHTKTAEPAPRAPGVNVEEFIKAALDQGHSPEAIATFLQKEGGLLQRIGGRIQEARGTRAVAKSRKLIAQGEAGGEKAFRIWEDRLRNGSSLGEKERNAIVSRARVALGDENASKLLHGTSYAGLPAAKGLKKPVDATAASGPKHVIGGNIGGAQVGITAEQMKKLKTPAVAVGAGYLGHKALSKSDDGSSKKKGVVIING